MFVEIAARTHFSFLRGGSSPRALLERAASLGYDAIGVADCDGLYGMVRALEAADETGVRLVVGCEIAIDPPDGSPGPGAGGPGAPSFLWLHVASREGYGNLCRILTESHERHPKGKARGEDEGVPRNQFAGLPLERVCASAGGLWCTAPPSFGAPASTTGHAPASSVASGRWAPAVLVCPSGGRPAFGGTSALRALKEAFGERLSLAAWRHLDGDDDARVAAAEALSRATGIPVCATNRVLFADPRDKPVFDVLHCIREGVTLDEAGRALLPNAEPHLRSRDAMARLFADHPAWLARSRDVADACRFSLRELDYRFPCELDAPAFPGETADEALRRLTHEGARRHWPAGTPPAVATQIEKELALVADLQVAPYFLSVQTIIQIARGKDIPARGAAARPTARSATAWASPRSTRRAATCSSSASSRPSGASRPTSTSTSSTSAARRSSRPSTTSTGATARRW